MKKSILSLAVVVALSFIGCKESPFIPSPGDNKMNLDSIPAIVDPLPSPDPEGADVPDSCLTVFEARNLCKKLANKEVTKEKYYVKGWVCSLDEKNEDGILSYGNATFYMAGTSDGKSDHLSFEAYQVYGKDGKKLVSVNQVKIGDFVVIYGPLTNFGGTAETDGKGAAHIYSSTNPDFDPQEDPTKITPDPEGANVPAGTINVYEARHISDSIGSGKTSKDEYYIKGWICRLDKNNESGITGNYHNATFYISATNDGLTSGFSFEAYRVKGPNKSDITSVDQVKVGDFVVLRAKIQNYSGTAETASGGYIYYSSNPLLQ